MKNNLKSWENSAQTANELKMRGITLLKKATALYPNLRVIILMGSPDLIPQPIEGINADALLTKPFYQADLLSHVAYCQNRQDPKKSDMRRPV
jgi:DNA-binding response OmpR family regulator